MNLLHFYCFNKSLKMKKLLLGIICCYACSHSIPKNENKVERIVCISKQYNEIIFTLKPENDIVAVDLSSTFPKELNELPKVGYHRALSAESILAVEPSLIIEDNNIGPEHVVSQIKQLGIPFLQFGKYKNTILGTDSLIKEIGQFVGENEKADAICTMLHQDMNDALSQQSKYTTKPKVLVIHYGRASNIYLVMTNKSTAGQLIEWAGGEMAIKHDKGMQLLSAEVVAASNPDIVLLTDYGYDRLGANNESINQLPGISATKAFKNNKIYRVEEHDMVYLGPRTGKIVLNLQQLIHQ